MSELLKSTTVRVAGVSFLNSDGTSRQQIISGLSVGEALLIEYFEYENEPAYAVKTAIGECIGNLPKSLSFDIHEKYRDCFLIAQVDDITGGYDGLKYGCIIDLSIYDTEPIYEPTSARPRSKVIPADTTPLVSDASAKRNSKYNIICGILYIILGIAAIPMGLLVAIIHPLFGFAFAIAGILSIIAGRKIKKSAKQK